jgi:hypothetical protein
MGDNHTLVRGLYSRRPIHIAKLSAVHPHPVRQTQTGEVRHRVHSEVVVAHRMEVVMATNYFFYDLLFYNILECSRVGFSFCEAEYLRAKNSTHESLLIGPLRYEYRL